MKHYILTRFNTGWKPNVNLLTKTATKKITVNSSDWLEDRCKLFDKYYLPSIEAQTSKDFEIYLSFSKETPQHMIDKYSNLPNINITYDRFDRDFKANLLGGTSETVITTRLDNDDIISDAFIEKIQEFVKTSDENRSHLIDVTGYQYNVVNSKYFRQQFPARAASSFCSASCKPSLDKKWCYETEHTKMPRHFPKKNMLAGVNYLQIVHTLNLYNFQTGNEVSGQLSGFDHIKFN